MTATVVEALVEAVRQEYAIADAEGRPRPGRPALIEKLANPPEISGHQVRKAKELVDDEDARPPAPDASEAPAATSPPAAAPADASVPRQPANQPLVLWPVNTAHRLAAVTERMTAALETASSPEPSPASHQPATSTPRPWPLVLIGLAAAVAVWSGWVGLGEMAGFGRINLLPGIGSGFTINSAIVLPISVEAYAAYALRVWLATSHSDRTIRFAKRSTIASLVVGAGAQVAYHLMAAAGYEQAPWWVVMLVAIIPVVVLGLASALAKLVSVDRQGGGHQ